MEKPSPLAVVVAGLAMLTLTVALAPATVASPSAVARVLGEARFQRALLLSLVTATISASIAVLLSIPVAYYVSRRSSSLARLVSSLHLLFLGLPPVGLGVSILILLRHLPPFTLAEERIGILFTLKAVIVAQAAVVAPLAISLLTSVFSYIPRTLDELASLYGLQGTGLLARILLPVALPGIAGAWVLSLFRAIGEFGATLVLAGNTPGYTETLPLAIYNMISVADVEAAGALLLVTVGLGVVLLLIYTRLQAVLSRRLEALGWG
ncbi:MAG: ABC transporter permease subunit [Desulfurococcales archaeon]|nr:ABC transporter permease subunit [Desulfurococcales archaeon]